MYSFYLILDNMHFTKEINQTSQESEKRGAFEY